MDKHKCSLCFRRFRSSRALGGHMRSHVSSATPPPKFTGYAVAEEGKLTEQASYGRLRVKGRKRRSAFFAVASTYVGESRTDGNHRCRSERAPHAYSRPEPASSASDVTTEEDVALCLMILSRDSWTSGDGEEGDVRPITSRSRPPRRTRSRRYQCGKCKKVFGRHRSCTPAVGQRTDCDDDLEADADAKVYECPFCLRVFASGQALGGHKRSHLTSSAAVATMTTTSDHAAKFNLALGVIDLNLPAPVDDDVALSAASDTEFFANHTAG
ncbi:hypothetical protein B296_00026303 [Ensete ventricosum]|uniref:C2H2-type domain-containing protein n=1 Tax=Ensete ventricosum TaxID=4639 RepID=A0A427AC22_ENSVE|nr:hypothetical protein B296_00026303 [Ensete ventricosum]